MLSKRHRLPIVKNAHYTHSVHAPLFTLRFTKNNLPESRFGFIVSKRVDKRAVVRNNIKRLFRQSIQGLLPTIAPGYDILFVIKSSAKDKEFSVIEEQVRKNLFESTIITI